MRVLLVTTDREDCGVREYGRTMMEYVKKADQGIVFEEWTNPNALSIPHPDTFDIIHINHIRGLFTLGSGMDELHWNSGHLEFLKDLGKGTVVTQHDSAAEWSTMMYSMIADFSGADALVVHEKVKGLTDRCPRAHFFPQAVLPPVEPRFTSVHGPKVGTIGFPFPWKNYDLLCEVSAEAGWGVMIVCPRATEAQVEKWKRINPQAEIFPEFVPREEMLALMTGCDATAFLYKMQGLIAPGSSAAIRIGIAARKPVIAFPASVNRQVTDLASDPRILWAQDRHGVVKFLRACEDEDFNRAASEAISEIAERDSWEEVGRKYANLYSEVSCIASSERMTYS